MVFAEVTFEGLYKSLDPIGELPDNARQPDEPVGDVLGLCAQPFKVRSEANLMRPDRSARSRSMSERRAYLPRLACGAARNCMVRSISSGDIGWKSTRTPPFRLGTVIMPSSF